MPRKIKKTKHRKPVLAACVKLVFYIAVALFAKNQFDEMGRNKETADNSIHVTGPVHPFPKPPSESNKDNDGATESLMAKTNIK